MVTTILFRLRAQHLHWNIPINWPGIVQKDQWILLQVGFDFEIIFLVKIQLAAYKLQMLV